jgi:hypothetical protein
VAQVYRRDMKRLIFGVTVSAIFSVLPVLAVDPPTQDLGKVALSGIKAAVWPTPRNMVGFGGQVIAQSRNVNPEAQGLKVPIGVGTAAPASAFRPGEIRVGGQPKNYNISGSTSSSPQQPNSGSANPTTPFRPGEIRVGGQPVTYVNGKPVQTSQSTSGTSVGNANQLRSGGQVVNYGQMRVGGRNVTYVNGKPVSTGP